MRRLHRSRPNAMMASVVVGVQLQRLVIRICRNRRRPPRRKRNSLPAQYAVGVGISQSRRKIRLTLLRCRPRKRSAPLRYAERSPGINLIHQRTHARNAKRFSVRRFIAEPAADNVCGRAVKSGIPPERLGKIITRIESAKVPVGTLDITFYRDDLSTLGPKPVVQQKDVGFDIGDKNIVLVDDVLFTGRTTRAALDALFEHGRPRRVQLCVLIDRGHREIPVEATFVGRNVQTTLSEVIEVKLTEIDDAEKVLLMEK